MKYVVVTVISREISTQFAETKEQAQKMMLDTYNEYLNSELAELEDSSINSIDYGQDEYECWITGNYDNVDIAIHEIL